MARIIRPGECVGQPGIVRDPIVAGRMVRTGEPTPRYPKGDVLMTVPESPPPATTLESLAAERFVALTTFRRSGAAVTTPVWIAGSAGALVVTTPAASGKVKRLRNNDRVQLQPCSRSGKIPPGAPTLDARGAILGPDTAHPDEVAAIRGKYGLEYRLIVAVEGLARRMRRQTSQRLILRITDAGAAD